jgi:hypothetical protein
LARSCVPTLLATLLLAVAIAGCWGGDNGNSTAEVEQAAREALTACKLRDVDVECRAKDDYWSCRYSSRGRSGVITLGDGDHPEISVIC